MKIGDRNFRVAPPQNKGRLCPYYDPRGFRWPEEEVYRIYNIPPLGEVWGRGGRFFFPVSSPLWRPPPREQRPREQRTDSRRFNPDPESQARGRASLARSARLQKKNSARDSRPRLLSADERRLEAAKKLAAYICKRLENPKSPSGSASAPKDAHLAPRHPNGVRKTLPRPVTLSVTDREEIEGSVILYLAEQGFSRGGKMSYWIDQLGVTRQFPAHLSARDWKGLFSSARKACRMGRICEAELPEYLEQIPIPSSRTGLTRYAREQYRHAIACLRAYWTARDNRKSVSGFKGDRNMLLSPLIGCRVHGSARRMRLQRLRESLAEGETILASQGSAREHVDATALREAMTAI